MKDPLELVKEAESAIEDLKGQLRKFESQGCVELTDQIRKIIIDGEISVATYKQDLRKLGILKDGR